MDDMGPVFTALGSATRRQILDIVKNDPGCSVGEVAAAFTTTRIAVMHQIRILEDAQLLISQKEGRTRRLYHNAVPIQLIYDRWTSEYSALWAGRMVDAKYAVEHPEEGLEHGGSTEVGVEGSDQGSHRGRVA
ncbi:MAG: ArsR/SmtB family transcription factor [Longimicrobiales bacterium]